MVRLYLWLKTVLELYTRESERLQNADAYFSRLLIALKVGILHREVSTTGVKDIMDDAPDRRG